ncbi:HutD family protein [Phyllobacterium sp. BT25]|uniref:HutD family protein n=1 Tax=Phyllobacterium pellucidum TaxID=2740464 RepID=A0A849VM75_9HYPH|nr:HutD family protein [Phyllobacterium pellucidum]NTS30988.1 HutD family protein [Phyllobacterium pellucidum]
MRILRAGAHKRMPWKNGAGVTTEIAIAPEGAAIDSFDWRISMAKVPDSGPFSAFAGIDRVLAVLDGAMNLQVGAGTPVKLDSTSRAIPFPGDIPTRADVIETVTDLNVMVRRGRFTARVTLLERQELTAEAKETFLLLRSKAALHTGETVEIDDVIHLARGETLAFVRIPESCWLIEINAS